MSVINTNVQSLVAQNALRQNNSTEATSLERLSTGLRINSGADDPSGLIASENLKSQTSGITTAIANANQANNIIGTADGALGEVSDLLTSLQGLVSQTANTGGLSTAEISANQSQIDSILGTINRIAGSTSFQGTQLLNGSLDYTTSGVTSTSLTNVQVDSANVAFGAKVTVNVQVVSSATTATLAYTGGAVSGASGVTIQLAGVNGTQQLSFTSGTTVSSIAASINAVKSSTGVSASVSGSDLGISSTEFGSNQYVSIKATTGTFTISGGSSGRATGTDAKVDINGAQASANGTTISYNANGLAAQFDLAKAFNKAGSTSFTVTGGGANFAIGSSVSSEGNASIGIQSVYTASLGNTVDGYLDSLGSGQTNSLNSNNLDTAQNIVNDAVNQVSSLRGRLGAFQTDTLTSTVNSLNVAYENASAAESDITDTNFAAETANLTRSEILVQSATTVLSQANAAPKNALTLLQNA
jgi:flagellin